MQMLVGERKRVRVASAGSGRQGKSAATVPEQLRVPRVGDCGRSAIGGVALLVVLNAAASPRLLLVDQGDSRDLSFVGVPAVTQWPAPQAGTFAPVALRHRCDGKSKRMCADAHPDVGGDEVCCTDVLLELATDAEGSA